jgi:hypothetical protein
MERQHTAGPDSARTSAMPTYVIVNRPPKGYTGSAESMAAWNAWFESLGADLVDRGNPTFTTSTLGNCGTDTALGGYTLVSAGDLDAALALAKSCPVLQSGGGVEVGELTVLNHGTRPIGENPG